MTAVLVDSCILLDLFTSDPKWADWSEEKLESCSRTAQLTINPIIYAEISVGFRQIEEIEGALAGLPIELRELPREALFLAGKVFLDYRRNRGTKSSTLPDFFIGAHAAVSGLALLTRDCARYRTYFPDLRLINPDT